MCRYSFFVVLYLLGVGGEIICTYVSLAHYKATNSLSILLPNNWNVTFSFYYFIIVFMLAYIPGIYMLNSFVSFDFFF